MQGRQGGMRGGKGDLFGKRSPFPPDPPTLPKTFIQAGMAGPRLADTGHGIVRCRRARLWGQAGILAAVRPGRNGPPVGKGHGRGAETVALAGRPYRGTDGSPFVPAMTLRKVAVSLPASFPKNKKACVPAGAQAVKARLGKEGGSLRGEGNRLCALAKGVPFPPQQNLCYRA